MKQPICLIIPPSAFLLDERVFMSLGILKVAAVLEEEGYPVHLLDLSGIRNYQEAVRDYAATAPAAVFGLTATTPQMPAAYQVARTIRSVKPDARILLGGPHVTLVHTAYKAKDRSGHQRATKAFQQLLDHFDVLVMGDGERAVFEAIREGAPRIVEADSPDSPLFLKSKMLEEFPLPARHLVDADSYRYWIDGERAMSLISQLGCPFACGFCGGRETPFLRFPRMRSVRNVVEEVAHMHQAYGVKGFMLYDDELNVNPKMVDLMRGLIELQSEIGAEFRLRGFIKSELFTNEQAKVMREAGFRWILVGFESGAPRILKNINKKASLDENTRCMEIAHRHGLKVKALMSLGHPGESPETVEETRQWLESVRPADFDATIITTFPGTPYYDQAVRDPARPGVWIYIYAPTGDRLYSHEVNYMDTANYYKGDPDGGYTSYVFTDYLSADELVEGRNHLESSLREKLGIPFNPGAPGVVYEHSMGQQGTVLPHRILRTSEGFSPRSTLSRKGT